MIHLLFGPDRYLVQTEVARLTAIADPDGMNTSRFEKSHAIAEVANAVATGGFFGTARVVVAEGIMARFRGPAKPKSTDLADLESLLGSVAPGNVLILVDPDLTTIPGDVRKLAGPDAIQFGGVVPRGHDLQQWVVDRVREAGGQIEARTASVLLDRLFPGDWRQANKPGFDSPPELQRLINEIAKLIAFADGAEILPADIEQLVASDSADALFPLIDAVVQGRARDAFQRMAGRRTDDDEASRVLAQLVANAQLAPVAAEFRGEAALQALAKELGGVNAARLAAIQRNFGRDDPTEFADTVLESERRLKTGITRSPVDQLHEVIVRRATRTRGRN